MSSTPASPQLATLRRIIVAVIVVSFSVAAIMGIIALLARDLGDVGVKVLLTTATVGLYSIAVLCCATLAGKRLSGFGIAGAAVAVLAAAYTVTLIWIADGLRSDVVYQFLGSLIALTVAWALASLLLLLADRGRPVVAWGLRVTLGLFAALLLLIWYLIWGEVGSGEVFGRLLGILSILAALGAVVVPVASLLLPDAPRAARLSPELAERLQAEATRRGITVDDLVAPLLAASERAQDPQGPVDEQPHA